MAMKRGPIDIALEQWRRERPDLDFSPIGVWGHVTRVSRIVRAAEKRILGQFDIETWEFEVLSTLRRSGPTYQLAPKQLGQAALVSSGALTNRIDHLERAGLVERHPDPHDRRGLLIQLTAKGKARVDEILEDYLAAQAQLLHVFASSERRTAENLFRKLLISLEEDVRRQPAARSTN